MRRRWAILLLAGVIVLALPLAALAAYPVYDWVDYWGALGTGVGEFTDPVGVAEGPYGEVFVTDYDSNEVQVFDADGTPLREFGAAELDSPWLLEVSDDGIVYVAGYGDDRITMWGTNGDYHGSVGSSGSGNGELDGPCDVAVGPDGLLYIAEWDNNRISVLEPDGTYVGKWGTTGSDDGQFVDPIAVEFDSQGRLWVADSSNDRLQYFTPTGTFLGKLGSTGTGEGQFDNPYDIKFDPHGDMYVADYGNDRVQKFGPDGTFITEFGTPGSGDGEFSGVLGVEPLRERYVMAVDESNNRVSRWFTPVPTHHDRVDGATRFLTAVAASEEAYPDGLAYDDSEGFKTVIVATGRNWPDALGGAALAGVLDAPILLTEPGILPGDVALEIDRLKATRVIVLGGEAAVSSSVADQLLARPAVVQVDRLGGGNRYETAHMIAERVVELAGPAWDYTAFIATGENFPDALAASPIAAANGWPLYLVPQAGLLPTTKTAMLDDGVVTVNILGGTAVVTPGTEAELNTTFGDANVDRIDGENRYETAVEVAWWGQSAANMNWTYLALATGRDFPDALTGGPMQGRDRSVMLLTNGTTALEGVVAGAIEDHKNAVWTVRYLGGDSALTPGVRTEAQALLY